MHNNTGDCRDIRANLPLRTNRADKESIVFDM